MEKRRVFAVILIACLLIASGALAAEGKAKMYEPGKTTSMMMDKIKASDLMGVNVLSPQGEKCGSISDVVIDRAAGQVAFTIMEADATFLGRPDRLFAIPIKALSPSAAGDAMIVNIDKEKLKTAPNFAKDKWPDLADQKWGSDVYRFYGIRPYWEEK